MWLSDKYTCPVCRKRVKSREDDFDSDEDSDRSDDDSDEVVNGEDANHDDRAERGRGEATETETHGRERPPH